MINLRGGNLINDIIKSVVLMLINYYKSINFDKTNIGILVISDNDSNLIYCNNILNFDELIDDNVIKNITKLTRINNELLKNNSNDIINISIHQDITSKYKILTFPIKYQNNCIVGFISLFSNKSKLDSSLILFIQTFSILISIYAESNYILNINKNIDLHILTGKELEVYRLLINGKFNKEISSELVIVDDKIELTENDK